ncbi:hypothetical protein [Frateuria defendens]|uniref:hypothetical protein n=1 Tax=Frateuria defendens TaxID=2219559 RepID=UPI00066FBF47|nr:hypothetical protein [Frateuria defendens]
MSQTFAPDSELDPNDLPEADLPPKTMRHPPHSALDTIEIAAADEVLHESALRESALRPPR